MNMTHFEKMHSSVSVVPSVSRWFSLYDFLYPASPKLTSCFTKILEHGVLDVG